jgi:translation initiation factor IF-3
MAWLYLRSKPNDDGTNQYYVGKTKHDNIHNRSDSRGAGKFAIGMDSKELAVKVSEETTHIQETEGIQFLVAFFGRGHVHNKQQIHQPVTGYKWDE